MKKYLVVTLVILFLGVGFVSFRPALASVGILTWPKTCVLSNGMYTETGNWVDNNGRVSAYGSLNDALKCVLMASLPKTVFNRLGKYGNQAVKDFIGDKPHTQIESMKRDAASEEE